MVFRRSLLTTALLAVLVNGCASSEVDISEIPDIPPVTTSDVMTLLAESEAPVVLNVWASWCIPCRSEAPLLDRAAAEFAGQVEFVGLNVRDSQTGARSFIAEFLPDAEFTHLYDEPGNVPVDLGGSRAVPLTFFYTAGGELIQLHTGVLDERTLALQIDELLARS